jgi:hypothetical protein
MAKFTKVGTVQRKKSGDGTSVKLGVYNKNPQYANTVTVTVKDSQGNIVAESDSPYLLVQDPRFDHKGEPTKFANSVPDFILHELVLRTEE